MAFVHDNVLVTGYGPFRDVVLNPSWQAVSKLPVSIGKYTVVTHELMVEYRAVSRDIPHLISHTLPKLIVHVGVGRKGHINLEERACLDGYVQKDDT